jgi:hypothetical protein
MNNIGLGVMIDSLGGNEETVKAFRASVGKKITALELKDEHLRFTFEDDTHLSVWDNGQSCCESRYMRTDDDLSQYIGGELTDMETREAPSVPYEYGEHEVEFLVVKTTKGQFTMSSHNEHNGYYGGFSIQLRND